METPKSPRPIADALLGAIADSGLNPVQLSKLCGVSRASVRRFVMGESGLQLSVAEKLCEHFGLELKPAKRSKKSKGAK